MTTDARSAGAIPSTTATHPAGQVPIGKSVTGSGHAGYAIDDELAANQTIHPYIHVVAMAIIGAVAVLAWLLVYDAGIDFLWNNTFVLANPWVFPVICMPLSLIVGLLVKYRQAPTNLDKSIIETLGEDASKITSRGLGDNIVMAWVSLFSGAVIGPEGGIGGIAAKLAAWYSERVTIPEAYRSRIVYSTLAAAYNGLIANPLFTSVLAVEIIPDNKEHGPNLPSSLVGGSIGFLIFMGVGYSGLQDYLQLAPSQPFAPVDVVGVVLFGLLGLALGVITGLLFKLSSALFGRFGDRVVERALVAGVIFSAVGAFAPILMFSGESQIQAVAADPAKYGAAVLIGMALVKLALLAVAFKSGFLGGPTFPAIFASTCVALAISAIFPDLRPDVVIGGVMGGFLMVLFKAPFMVILLTAVFLGAGPELTALIGLAVGAVLIVMPYVMAIVQRRQASRAPSQPG